MSTPIASLTESMRIDSAHQSSIFLCKNAARQARDYLLSQQQDDGHWVAELQGDTILESEYILLMAFLGRERDEKCRKAANYLLERQMQEGGWDNYPGGPPDLSTCVKAYFALKLTGHDPNAEYMRKAREVILSLGGIEGCNSFTKFYLALLGQTSYDNCPAVPPEMILLPTWFYFNIYAMSSWSRTIFIPLSIVCAHRPVRQLSPNLGIAELYVDSPKKIMWAGQPSNRWFTWTNFFLFTDQILKWIDPQRESYPSDNSPKTRWERFKTWVTQPFVELRRLALERCKKWMLDHFEDSDGVGAIFPPMVYTVISLRCLGYADDSPEMVWALKQLDDLIIEEGDSIRLQPCFSPVWDTSLCVNALAMVSGTEQKEPLDRAAQWLLSQEVRRPGDWSPMNPGLEPAGWFFEYRNGFYPDIDDTAMVLMGLARSGHALNTDTETPHPTVIPAVRRGLNWLLAMQNSDGGWAAFDRDINREILTKVPFADHNAMLDPSCPDITARVLEALAQYGHRIGQPHVDRALSFIERTQDERGCWIGRWGVNYLYGTWQVLQGLEAIGFDTQHSMVQRAVSWLKEVQQECGGWGETCRSYDDPSLAGQGTPTASQTAWALLGLIGAGEAQSAEVQSGVNYLMSIQRSDGNWDEEPFTGTGFPKVFYLRYHYYRLYFPLMALARYEQALSRKTTTDGLQEPHIRSVATVR